MCLPKGDLLHRTQALQLLVNGKATIETRGEWDLEEESLAMALSQVYLEWEKEIEQRGRQQAFLTALLNAIEIRFGSIPSELREQLQAQSEKQLLSLRREALLYADLDTFLQHISSH